MTPQVQRQQPPYLQITQHYRDKIQSGELRNGDRIPSARQLVRDWDVSHATAAKVLATLRAEGLVTTTSGGAGGTVVNVEVGASPRDHILAIRRSGNIYPKGGYARIVSAELSPAPERVAEALGVQVDAQVVRRHRITHDADGRPVSASTSWFTGELAEAAPNLLAAERIKQGTPGYIQERTGRRVRHGRDQVTAILADHAAAADLDIAEGDPILVARNWYRDASGEVIEYGEYVSVSGRWQTYEYDFPD